MLGLQANSALCRECNYLEVHLCQADQHPCYKPLPEANRNEAHLKHSLNGVGCEVPHAVGVQAGFGWKEMRQEIAETPKGAGEPGPELYCGALTPEDRLAGGGLC